MTLPVVAALVLAAGASSRMAPDNKLLLRDTNGLAMVGRVALACCASRANLVTVVTGHQAIDVERAVRAAVPDDRLNFVHSEDYAAGLSASLKAGIGSLPAHTDAALVCLGDMPLVTGTLIDRLVAVHAAAGSAIVVPTCRGRRGNPVLWPRRFFPDIAALSGDAGARILLRAYAAEVMDIEMATDAVLQDFDTPESLRRGF